MCYNVDAMTMSGVRYIDWQVKRVPLQKARLEELIRCRYYPMLAALRQQLDKLG